MRFLSLFSGIGGFDLGLERAGMECVGQVEIDPYCQAVLAKHWPNVKRIGDIRDVRGDEFGAVDLICGGFPCQPFSNAGKRKGAADDRYLWPEMLRVIQAYRPTWVLGENVAGIIGVELDKVLSDLEGIGYEMQCFVIPACAVDAPHRRDRVWIVAHSECVRRRESTGHSDSERQPFCEAEREESAFGFGSGGAIIPNSERIHDDNAGYGAGQVCGQRSEASEVFGVVSDSCGARLSGREQLGAFDGNGGGQKTHGSAAQLCENVSDSKEQRWRERNPDAGRCGEGTGAAEERAGSTDHCRWLPEPKLGRVANGIPNRSHRLKALGNAVVPQIVEQIGKAIMEADQIQTQIEKVVHSLYTNQEE